MATKREAAGLREHLLFLLGGGGAHLDFEAAFADVPAALQGARPDGVTYTPWRLLEHMRIVQWDILEFIRNPKHISPDYPDGYWPGGDAPPRRGDYKKSLEAFRSDQAALEAIVRDPATDFYESLPHGEGQTILREILLVADHNSYHLGEMVVVRTLLGICPEDA